MTIEEFGTGDPYPYAWFRRSYIYITLPLRTLAMSVFRRCPMYSEGLPLPIKVTASVPPLMYGTMLFFATGTPRVWLGIVPAIFVLLFVLISYLEYPFAYAWPAFAGVFLLTTCILSTMWDFQDRSPVPFTHTGAELWAGALIGFLYLMWGVLTARRAVLAL
jgi:hypothetical protein